MFATKTFLLLACGLVIAMATPNADDRPLLGGISPLKGEQLQRAEKQLKESLDKLAAGDGPYYKISKVNSATGQVVNGYIFRLDVDLVDKNNQVKNCKVSLWVSRDIEVTFDCKGEEKLVKKHSA